MSRDTRYSQLFNQLLEVDGPFLTVPNARRAFGSIIEPIQQQIVDDLRIAIEERDIDSVGLNSRWMRWVLQEVLGFEADLLLEGPPIAHLSYLMPAGATLRPTLVVDDPSVDGVFPRLLVSEWPPGVNLEATTQGIGTSASPHSQMIELCQALKVPLGLVTNGDDWILVYAPADGAVSSATWNVHLWLEERETLDFFAAFCGARSFFGRDEENTIEALFRESADSGEEVTNTLGRQVKRAVELLVSALSEANRERHGVLLADTTPENVYRAAVTVMMRLVFLLSAEERDLLLLGDDVYDSNYAISTMWEELDATGDDDDHLFGRFDAWPRVLATFRLIYGGVQHDQRLSLPAYGGQLFDPDRFPFLEGRQYGEQFEVNAGDDRLMKAINNKVMKEVLRSLQWLALDRFGEVRRVSYINLDVEQIGTVYEGLLDYTAVVVSEPTLGLLAKKSRKGNVEPEIPISVVEEHASNGRDALEKWLKDEHKFSKTELKKLDYEMSDIEERRLLSACANDANLAERIAPYFGVLRKDLRDLPEVFPTDSFVVTTSSERSSTGAHYTPRSIADEIVKYTLEPLVYEPGPQNEEDSTKWKLRPWQEIVDLKIVDPACGSGAMLVAASRYLASRLVEAWGEQDDVQPEVGLSLPGADGAPLVLPSDSELWTIEATRLIAGRCLYGVDINEMAVEMCKLSLWLVTLARGKPFSFLDHAIRHGDSLLGVTSLDEIRNLRLGDSTGDQSFGWSEALGDQFEAALEKRLDLLAMPTLSPSDVEEKDRLFQESQTELARIAAVADALAGAYLSTAGKPKGDRATRLTALAGEVAEALAGGEVSELESRASFWLNEGRPYLSKERRAFHWPIAFPEVFLSARQRFDGTVSNPPFLGGTDMSGYFGKSYREHVVEIVGDGAGGKADLVAYFLLRSMAISSSAGLLATNTVGQGDTSAAGLAALISRSTVVFRAASALLWPGTAAVEVAAVWLTAKRWRVTRLLDGQAVPAIDATLYAQGESEWRREPLFVNRDKCFEGSKIDCAGFEIGTKLRDRFMTDDAQNDEVLFQFVNGKHLLQGPVLETGRVVINFAERSEADARQFEQPFRHILENVKPAVEAKPASYKSWENRWWQYWRPREALYSKIRPMPRAIALAKTSKTLMPRFVDPRAVFSHAVAVFSYDDYFHLGLLSSGFHYRWAYRYASTMRNDLRYTPSDVFETFAQPEPSRAVEVVARRLDEHRSSHMVAANEGLTDTYNQVHEPMVVAPDILKLRKLHVELDIAVRDAYGWDDLDLEHGFHPVRGQGIRYTFSPDASVEVLYRLLELNRARYEAEVEEGLHGDDVNKKATKKQVSQSESLF